MDDLTHYLEYHAQQVRDETQIFTGKFLVSR